MKATYDEIELLIAMARQRPGAVSPQRIATCRAGGVDWGRFRRLAEAERIAPLVWRNLLGQPELLDSVPDDVRRLFERSKNWNAAVKAARVVKTADVARWFREHGIRVMLIKGAALDQVVYQEPWLIASDDVDLIIDREPEAMPKDWQTRLKRSAGKTRIFEMDCGRHHDLDLNGLLEIDYDRIWRDAQPLEMHGVRVWVMSSEHLLIAACIQLWRRRFSRLKEACAVAEILDVRSDLDWTALAADARRFGAERIVATALVVARSLLGCPIPDAACRALPIGPLTRTLGTGMRSLLLAKRDGERPARREMAAGVGLKFFSLRPGLWRRWLLGARQWQDQMSNAHQLRTIHFDVAASSS